MVWNLAKRGGALGLAICEKNGRRRLLIMGAESGARLRRNEATRLGPWAQAPFDLVFLDPPYGKSMGQKALIAAAAGSWLAPGAMIVWEENTPMHAPEGFARIDTRKYGDTHVTLLQRAEGK